MLSKRPDIVEEVHIHDFLIKVIPPKQQKGRDMRCTVNAETRM